jgi:small subunit ribosomal protein S8
MMTDPIADMLTCIRNAVRIERPHVGLPLSKVKRGVAEVLKREGYIWDWREVSDEDDGADSADDSRGAADAPEKRFLKRQLVIQLKYGPNGERVIRHIRRVSKPGRRVYSPANNLKPVLNGLGISIISTSRGVISDREARQRNLGGEVLCEVW